MFQHIFNIKTYRLGYKYSSLYTLNEKNFNPQKADPFVKYGDLHQEYATNLVARIEYHHFHWIQFMWSHANSAQPPPPP